MARTKGARNEDYEAKRTALIARLRARLRAPGQAASLRDLAAAAGVTLPTLHHYFGDPDGAVSDRDAIVRAVLEDELAGAMAPRSDGRVPPLAAAAEPDGPFARSIRALLAHADGGFEHGGLTAAHAAGLAEGLRSPHAAAAYLALSLDPTLDAFARRLQAHQARGEMREDVDARIAAIQLLAPLLVARLHQDRLEGRQSNPIDMARLREQVAAGFVRAFARPPAGRQTDEAASAD